MDCWHYGWRWAVTIYNNIFILMAGLSGEELLSTTIIERLYLYHIAGLMTLALD